MNWSAAKAWGTLSSALLFAFFQSTAQADVPIGTPVAAAIITDKAAPATISTCRVVKGSGYRNEWVANVTLGNRTKHTLIAADLAAVAYDSEGAKISQTVAHLPLQSPVASRDTGVYNQTIYFALDAVANNPELVAKISCRIVAAQFTSNKKWTVGQTWPEPLLSIEQTQMVDSGGASVPVRTAAAAAPRLQIAVTNSWNDTFNGNLIVHDTITITGGDTEATLKPNDLVLTMKLANGSSKQFFGLPIASPLFARVVPGVGTTMVPEVAPANDFGKIGPMTIPAHGTVTTTVTFGVTDVPAAPTDNRNVSVR